MVVQNCALLHHNILLHCLHCGNVANGVFFTVDPAGMTHSPSLVHQLTD